MAGTIYLLRCPKCKNTMKYDARTLFLSASRKRCVYCGVSFRVREQIIGKE
ncbi:hypothetical protein HYS47_00910 [Candidatus Woesearchaeota archaeon]|nr:hypothetical protein [Candidatus Woesearchaeota archaeon]